MRKYLLLIALLASSCNSNNYEENNSSITNSYDGYALTLDNLSDFIYYDFTHTTTQTGTQYVVNYVYNVKIYPVRNDVKFGNSFVVFNNLNSVKCAISTSGNGACNLRQSFMNELIGTKIRPTDVEGYVQVPKR
jgi:hypothetical protein